MRATLRAFDRDGNLVAQAGPIAIGPGPTPITTPMELGARLFLRDVFINRSEFGLGYCVPADQFTEPNRGGRERGRVAD